MDATATPFPSKDELERRLPRYRLTRQLSQTGMSVVYQAVDTQVGNRPVALKVLAPDVRDDAEFRRRFVREVHNAGRLHHPNIVQIYDGPEAQGLFFLTMPFIEGRSLGDLLKERGRLELPEAARIIGQVAAALDFAHTKGLVHRDVKPGNILVESGTGQVYLCDFGIAKAVSEEGMAEPLTQIGSYIGTPGYIAPEAIRFEGVDQRADIYALGVVLYQCLTGRQPHQESGQNAKLAAQVREEPPPVSTLRPGLPGGLDAVVGKAMAKRPEDRYGNCREFAGDLARVVGSGPDTATHRPTPPGRKAWPVRVARKHPVLVALVSAVAGVGAITAVLAVLVAPYVLGRERSGPQPMPNAGIPAALRSDCRPVDSPRFSGAVAETICRSGAGEQVRLGLFGDRTAMDKAYDGILAKSRIARASGDCTEGTGGEHRYPGVGTPVGRVLCFTGGGTASLVWTSDRTRTIARLDGRDSDDLRMARSWSSWVRLPRFPAQPEKALLDLVEVPRSDCRRAPPGSLDRLRDAIAGVECTSWNSGASGVSYFRFADKDGLRRSFNDDVRRSKAPGNIYCGEGDAPGFLGSKRFDLRSVELGGLLCHPESHGRFVMEWSVEALNVLGRAVGDDGKKLASWWRLSYGPPTRTIVSALNSTAEPKFPTAGERRLLAHVPSASRVNCIRPSKGQIRTNVGDAEVTAVVCGPTAGAKIVFYYQFRDRAAMDRSFAANIQTDGPDCTKNPSKFSGAAGYFKDDRPAGRLLCGMNDGEIPYLSWTNNRLKIQGFAFQTESPAVLIDWWRTAAGPD